MTRYFDDTHIQQVLQASDIVEIVSNYVALKPHGREMVGLCPFHNDNKPSLNVSSAKQIFKCFSCGAGGDAIKFIMLKERMTFPEAVVTLAEKAGIALPQRKSAGSDNYASADRNKLVEINRWAARYFRSQYENEKIGQQARQYIKDRGISEATSRRFGLGWAPEGWDLLLEASRQEGISTADLINLGLLVENEQGQCYDRFRQRVMFPVIDGLGRVIAFGGRTLADDPAKYLNSPESVLFDKSRTLYGIHAAKDSIIKENMAIVVEGYTDCMMAHQFEINNVVATLGTALTPEHARGLSRYAGRIVLMFDADSAGQKAAERTIELFIGQAVQLSLVKLPECKDPCDFLLAHGREALMSLVNSATEALEYKWHVMCERLEKDDAIGGKKRAVEEFLKLVGQVVNQGEMDKISEGFLLNRVAKLVGRPVQMVHETVGQLRRQQRYSRNDNSSGGGAASYRTMVSDSVIRSQEQILEVLLNRPDLFGQVTETMVNADDFSDPELKQIAEHLWHCFQQDRGGTLGSITAGCQSPELCNRMIAMAEQGGDRGNYQQTLTDALGNLQFVKEKHKRMEMHRMAAAADKDYGPDAQTAMLLELQTKLQTNIKPDLRKTGGLY